MSDMSQSLSIRLPDGLRRDLAKMSKRQRRPASDIAREALRQYMASQELRTLRARLRPRAEAAGFLTDEDFFKAVS